MMRSRQIERKSTDLSNPHFSICGFLNVEVFSNWLEGPLENVLNLCFDIIDVDRSHFEWNSNDKFL